MFGLFTGALGWFGLGKGMRAGRGCGYGRMGAGHCGSGWGHGGGDHHHGGWGRHGWGHGGGHQGWGQHGRWGRDQGGWQGGSDGQRGGRNAFGLRWVFERLDTTPGQEKVIRQAYEEVRESMRSGEGELEATRREIGAAIRAGHVDETQMGELYARHDEKLRTMRTAFFGALAKVTEALDEDQRKILADMLDRGQGGFFGGPYRGRHES